MKTDKVYILNTIVITLCILLLCSACSHQGEPIALPQKPLPSGALQRAEDLFRQREDIYKLREAVAILAAARNPDQRNFEIEWKFAQYSCFLGRQSSDEKEKSFNNGKEAARLASRLRPERPEGHFWFAANLGELARLSPVSVGLRSVDDIRTAASKVIEVDPSYQGASAFDILAQVELSTYLFGGRPQKAAELLEKGIALEKNNSLMRIDLARAYLAMNKYGPARQQLEYVLKMEPPTGYVLEHEEALKKARLLLETKF